MLKLGHGSLSIKLKKNSVVLKYAAENEINQKYKILNLCNIHNR